MKTIKVYTKSTNWITSVNSKVPKDGIIGYFLGQIFNIGNCDISEKLERCVKIEELKDGVVLWTATI